MSTMSGRIHDDELDTSEDTVRSLLSAQCPDIAELSLTQLATSGTDNAMWRVHDASEVVAVVRLPRRVRSGPVLEHEVRVLHAVGAGRLAMNVHTPRVLHAGRPGEQFPIAWAVLGWLSGEDAWTARSSLVGSLDQLAVELAGAVRAISALKVDARARRPGERGGPIGPLLDDLDRWLEDPQWCAPDLIDVATVRRLAHEGREVADQLVPTTFLHGDLIPGNLLVASGHLSAVIDWGRAGYGDPAEDLIPAWAVFDARARRVFREAVGPDDARWLRARTFALAQAVAGVLYYRPKRHPLGDVMGRTLRRILTGE